MTTVENKNIGTGGASCTDNIPSQPVMKAGYVQDLKMDEKLNDPIWCNAPDYRFELAENAYAG